MKPALPAARQSIYCCFFGCLVGSFFAACSPRTNVEGGGGLTVTPKEVTLVTSKATTAQFKAVTSNGDNVTQKADWKVEDPRLGTIAAGLFTVADGLDHGGTTKITANNDGALASAVVNIKLVAPDIIDSGAGNDAPDAFGGPGGGPSPAPVYPIDGVMLARNIAGMRLAWRADSSQQLFRIKIDSPTYERSLYLGRGGCKDDKCSYLVDDDEWTRMARSVAGGKATLTFAGTAGAGQPVGAAPPMALYFSPEDVRGGMYYFSTSREGLMRLPFGGKRALKFVWGTGQQGDINACIGCHAVSRDGSKVAAVWGGGDGFGGIVKGTDASQYLMTPKGSIDGQVWNFASYNPDGSRLIAVWRGEMTLRDGTTGALVSRVDAGMLGGKASMVEWSPDGQSIVFVRIPPEGRLGYEMPTGRGGLEAGDWILGDAGEIAVVPYNNGSFGPATTIVPRVQNQEYHFYPSFSPDSQWIVFNSAVKGDCFSPTAANNGVNVAGRCMTYDQRAARLRLVRAAAGEAPVELQNATHLPDHTTAWPKFAPFQQNGNKLVFFTFSSKFDYGWTVDQAAIMQQQMMEPMGIPRGRPQIWMSAIDLSKAAMGADPSYPPFWLPFQEATNSNHEVIWTKDIACLKASDCGDEFDCRDGVCVPKLG